jgi:hypothetical protein
VPTTFVNGTVILLLAFLIEALEERVWLALLISVISSMVLGGTWLSMFPPVESGEALTSGIN